MANPIVLVPARMSSTRLPGKPLADIWGEPMIVHVEGDLPTIARQAVRAAVGPLADRDVDIVTLATEIRRAREMLAPKGRI